MNIFPSKKKTERQVRLDEQEKELDEKEKEVEDALEEHTHVHDEDCKVCKKINDRLERKKETQVKSKEISDRTIKGRRKTEIIRRNDAGLAAEA